MNQLLQHPDGSLSLVPERLNEVKRELMRRWGRQPWCQGIGIERQQGRLVICVQVVDRTWVQATFTADVPVIFRVA